ncbi:MAG: zinc ribbon domain-containing protein [Acidaminococcaceae bacterium]|nr:zinc ribbon domain-containing protein [Acidaminococcaceae bacterium]
MQIKGGGGYFDNRVYEVEPAVAWQIAILCVAEMGVEVAKRDDEMHLIEGTMNKKIFEVCVQTMDSTTCQLVVDCRKKVIQVYNWKPGDKEVNEFYDKFEHKLKEFAAFILCPHCKAKISSSAKFCPECGIAIK